MHRVDIVEKDKDNQTELIKVLETKNSITLSYTLATSGLVFSAKAYDLFALVCQKTKKLMTRKDFEHISQGNLDKIKINNKIHISREEIANEWGVEVKRLPWVTRKVKHKDGRVTEKPSLLEEAAKELGSLIPYKNVNNKTWGYINIIQTAYFDNNGLTIELTDAAIVAIYNRTKGFGLVDLKVFFKLKSKYSKKLFDLISVNKYATYDLNLSIGEYKTIMGYTEPVRKKELTKRTNDFSNFITQRVTKPINEIVAASKELNKNKVWVIDESKGTKKGYSIIRQVGNRTLDSDRIVFHLNYIAKTECSPKEAAQKLTAEKEKLVAPTDDLLELSEIVAAWRKGIAPTQTQAMDILMEIDELEERELLTKSYFKKLRKAVPPID